MLFRSGSTITALLSPLEPVTAIIIGIIVFNENINIQIVTGVIIIILAVILIVLQEKKKNQKELIHKTERK